MQTFLRINEDATPDREWFRLFQGIFYTWQKDPLQPLLKRQRIHTEGLFTGEFTAAWPGFVPFAASSQGGLYLEQYVGNTILNIVHCLDYTSLLPHFNNTTTPRGLAGYEIETKKTFLITFDIYTVPVNHLLRRHIRWFYTSILVYNRAFFGATKLASI